MKNKIIINILIGYFLILSIVLLIQVSYKETVAIEPLTTEITSEDKLKNAVVLCINSPVTIINEKQFLIDKNDSSVVPVIKEGKVYIPAILLKTAFNANISFNKLDKETIIRINNKAMIFSNNKNTMYIMDNTSEETIDIDAEPLIINDRFYIPLRSFGEIFEKEIFYNNDLIIISNIKNIFDPIEEIYTIEELIKKVKQLPIVGNYDNLKSLMNKNHFEELKSQNTDLINLSNVEESLKTNKKIIIKKTNNFNFYISESFIEAYFKNNKNTEIFSFKIEKISNNIKDIKITDNRLILTYSEKDNDELDYSKTIIYDISNKQYIKTLKVVENNGVFYESVIDGSYLYTIFKININKNKNILPIFNEYFYENEINNKIIEQKFNFENIYYFPDINDNKYTILSSININDLNDTIKNYSYFGMGENIVIHDGFIYILTTKGNNNNIYLFEVNLGEVSYVKRIFIKGDVIKFTKDSLFENEFLKENEIIVISIDNDREIEYKYFDKNLRKIPKELIKNL